MRQSITPHERLSATLRCLATGRNYEDLKFRTNISAQCLGIIVPGTAICKILYEMCMVGRCLLLFKAENFQLLFFITVSCECIKVEDYC